METLQIYQEMPCWVMPVLISLAIWDSIWKLIGLWKSAGNKHLIWFICIAILNTVGILPIVYIFMHRKRKEDTKQMSNL
jgi:hypothetical protein